MTPDELRALADAATPGPWSIASWDELAVTATVDDSQNPGKVVESSVADSWDEHDARLIVLAPSLARDHAALLDWAERARAWIEDAGDVEIAAPYPMDVWREMVARREALLAEMQERPS